MELFCDKWELSFRPRIFQAFTVHISRSPTKFCPHKLLALWFFEHCYSRFAILVAVFSLSFFNAPIISCSSNWKCVRRGKERSAGIFLISLLRLLSNLFPFWGPGCQLTSVMSTFLIDSDEHKYGLPYHRSLRFRHIVFFSTIALVFTFCRKAEIEVEEDTRSSGSSPLD